VSLNKKYASTNEKNLSAYGQHSPSYVLFFGTNLKTATALSNTFDEDIEGVFKATFVSFFKLKFMIFMTATSLYTLVLALVFLGKRLVFTTNQVFKT
jgi:hypothetical protein